jgi:hypothetical protein
MSTHPLTGEPLPPTEGTFWNGLPTEATRGTAVVADAPQFPLYWAKREGIIGQRIPVVRVVLDGVNYGGGVDYLDDRDGSGWRKVTEGHGGPRWPHSGVEIEEGSFAPLAAVDAAPDAEFRFGDPKARDDMGGCCGKWRGCWIESKGCVHKVEKAEWQALAEQEHPNHIPADDAGRP